MEKKLLVLLGLVLVAGGAFAQTTPSDSKPAGDAPKEKPHITFKVLPETWAKKWETDKQALAPNPLTLAEKPEVTPFYSNMPVAKAGRKRTPMPLAPTDSTVHYHLLKKRFKVLPLPKGKTQAVPELEVQK
ncbi:hypothetical protein ACD591_02390 [Rufibacter glacialis]|uniref:Uncharacterized protein n=1 Tax=Rufibacter glacialis TaxID=1259555 RepID=A0A5M8QKG9_9BACT|nr:hypothetical protein [Rufibacter glacialis]KAA6435738.1 hypothetical protein FOE74_07290 [Rufibacter glacialis]GGK66101.1 hypothetical protein GCM10011405_12570 [Rufibacter glacialis]